MRDLVRRAVIGWLRAVGDGADRVSRTAGAALDRLGATTEPGPERVVIEALSGQLRQILDLPRPERAGSGREGAEDDRTAVLRERFSELLRRSLSAAPPVDIHPAFGRIIEEISPDEARIIRFFDQHGPQPVVHVVAAPRIGSGGRTVAENLCLVGDRAGCHRPELAPTYLDNLSRLGVVKLHDEELVGHDDYELIEARPEFKEAAAEIESELRQRARADRRTARLTPLGERFCEVCLPRDGDPAVSGEPVAHRDED